MSKRSFAPRIRSRKTGKKAAAAAPAKKTSKPGDNASSAASSDRPRRGHGRKPGQGGRRSRGAPAGSDVLYMAGASTFYEASTEKKRRRGGGRGGGSGGGGGSSGGGLGDGSRSRTTKSAGGTGTVRSHGTGSAEFGRRDRPRDSGLPAPVGLSVLYHTNVPLETSLRGAAGWFLDKFKEYEKATQQKQESQPNRKLFFVQLPSHLPIAPPTRTGKLAPVTPHFPHIPQNAAEQDVPSLKLSSSGPRGPASGSAGRSLRMGMAPGKPEVTTSMPPELAMDPPPLSISALFRQSNAGQKPAEGDAPSTGRSALASGGFGRPRQLPRRNPAALPVDYEKYRTVFSKRGANVLKNVPSGRLGWLQVRKSGAVELVLDSDLREDDTKDSSAPFDKSGVEPITLQCYPLPDESTELRLVCFDTQGNSAAGGSSEGSAPMCYDLGAVWHRFACALQAAETR